MPQDNPRIEGQCAENIRGDSPRPERSRSEKSARAETLNAPFGETGAANIDAGLRMQKQMFDVFEGIGRNSIARTTSRAELACKLPNKLSAASSVSDAFAAYQEWLGGWMNMFGEDSRRMITDGQKIMDTGSRCFARTSPLGTS